jgi:C1A family cysteine protease
MRIILLFYLSGIALLAVSLARAAEPASVKPMPSVAPRNPAFVEYLEKQQDEGQALSVSGESRRFGYCPSPVDLSHLRATTAEAQPLSLPSSFDLRLINGVTAVKAQGIYGTCWAHASMAALESCIQMKTGESLDFSENNLVNLAGFSWDGWEKGNARMSLAYLTRWSGPVLERNDPYPAPGGSPSLSAVRHLINATYLPARTGPLDNNVIKQAITTHGGVLANYYHDPAPLTTYYNATTHSYYYPGGPDDDNHAIVLVGWDDQYSRTRFNHTPAGDGAFIVKNSWGSGWGEAGYFYISYYDLRIGYGEVVLFYDAIPTRTYSKVYQYDPLGQVSAIGYVDLASSWCAAIFPATGDEIIGAVGFYVMAKNTAYQIYLYKNVTVGQPSTGTLVASLSGTSADAGYRTVEIPAPVKIANGVRFSVVLKLTTPDYNWPLAFEYVEPGYSSGATASPGETFMSYDGSDWTDFTSYYNTGNFCIKAYVLNEVPVITGARLTSLSGTPHFQIEYTGINGITNRILHKASVTNLNWSAIRTNVPSYTGIQTNQLPVQTESGIYRISRP